MFSVLRRQFGRLSFRLTLWHALLFLIAAIAVLQVTYAVIRNRIVAQERADIEARLHQYASGYESGGLSSIKWRTSYRKGRDQNACFLRLANAQNQTLFLRDAEDWAEFKPARLEDKVLPGPDEQGWLKLNSRRGLELVVAYKRFPDGAVMQVGNSTEKLEQLRMDFRSATLIVLLVFLPLSVAGGALVSSRALRPVQHLTAAAEQIVATARFDARVPSRGTSDELDSLVQLFNKMLERIERLIRSMNESLDNVAHDLRTPMTRLQQKAQSVLEGESDLESTREALADCVEESKRAMTLLNTLMDIAETESGVITFQRLPIEVAKKIQWALNAYAEMAEEKNIALTAEVPRDLWINGDADALRRVFANLLDNAIKYTPSGGSVRIVAKRLEKVISIEFIDTGAGISPEDLPRIWDRLFRSDKSRAERGLGLGLSFVHAIVSSHSGTATVSSDLGVGTTVTIEFPAAQA